ncbi:unnamed protein product [Amoebophrya sp. A25]|nr:unnamed protein product [Amoebophrya sp. A25]|eukprot:GSA25T00002834001.1
MRNNLQQKDTRQIRLPRLDLPQNSRTHFHDSVMNWSDKSRTSASSVPKRLAVPPQQRRNLAFHRDSSRNSSSRSEHQSSPKRRRMSEEDDPWGAAAPPPAPELSWDALAPPTVNAASSAAWNGDEWDDAYAHADKKTKESSGGSEDLMWGAPPGAVPVGASGISGLDNDGWDDLSPPALGRGSNDVGDAGWDFGGTGPTVSTSKDVFANEGTKAAAANDGVGWGVEAAPVSVSSSSVVGGSNPFREDNNSAAWGVAPPANPFKDDTKEDDSRATPWGPVAPSANPFPPKQDSSQTSAWGVGVADPSLEATASWGVAAPSSAPAVQISSSGIAAWGVAAPSPAPAVKQKKESSSTSDLRGKPVNDAPQQQVTKFAKKFAEVEENENDQEKSSTTTPNGSASTSTGSFQPVTRQKAGPKPLSRSSTPPKLYVARDAVVHWDNLQRSGNGEGATASSNRGTSAANAVKRRWDPAYPEHGCFVYPDETKLISSGVSQENSHLVAREDIDGRPGDDHVLLDDFRTDYSPKNTSEDQHTLVPSTHDETTLDLERQLYSTSVADDSIPDAHQADVEPPIPADAEQPQQPPAREAERPAQEAPEERMLEINFGKMNRRTLFAASIQLNDSLHSDSKLIEASHFKLQVVPQGTSILLGFRTRKMREHVAEQIAEGSLSSLGGDVVDEFSSEAVENAAEKMARELEFLDEKEDVPDWEPP